MLYKGHTMGGVNWAVTLTMCSSSVQWGVLMGQLH